MGTIIPYGSLGNVPKIRDFCCGKIVHFDPLVFADTGKLPHAKYIKLGDFCRYRQVLMLRMTNYPVVRHLFWAGAALVTNYPGICHLVSNSSASLNLN